jgi:putative SOS response-associated peptidase YedK
VASTDTLPAVRYDARASERTLDVMRWGPRSVWAKDIKVGFANINAEAEGIESKPAFREAFQRRRCLVPVDNFYADAPQLKALLGIVNLSRGGILLPWVARRSVQRSPWHAYRAAPSQEKGAKKVDATELS